MSEVQSVETAPAVEQEFQTSKILVRLQPSLHARAKRLALAEGQSLNRFCREAIDSWCNASEDMQADAALTYEPQAPEDEGN